MKNDTKAHNDVHSNGTQKNQVNNKINVKNTNNDSNIKTAIKHHEEICHHLYNNGFINGQYYDVLLHVPSLTGDRAYKLHAIVLSRSTLLAEVLSKAVDYKEITLEVDDPNITEQSFAISIGHLYAGYSHKILNMDNAKNVLASAYYLKLFDLCDMATQIICNHIDCDSIKEVSKFVQGSDTHRSNPLENSLENSPSLSILSFTSQSATEHPNYGEYTERIKTKCMNFLLKELFENVVIFGSNKDSAAYNKIVEIFVELSFEWLKFLFSSSELKVPNNERYKFAQEVVKKRKNKAYAGNWEESVVLAFGSSDSNVSLVRKAPKKSK